MDRILFADELSRFLHNESKKYEFDDLVSVQSDDPLIEAYRIEILNLPEEYPPSAVGAYTSEAGMVRLAQIIRELRDVSSA